jgi:hypothetical protein
MGHTRNMPGRRLIRVGGVGLDLELRKETSNVPLAIFYFVFARNAPLVI